MSFLQTAILCAVVSLLIANEAVVADDQHDGAPDRLEDGAAVLESSTRFSPSSFVCLLAVLLNLCTTIPLVVGLQDFAMMAAAFVALMIAFVYGDLFEREASAAHQATGIVRWLRAVWVTIAILTAGLNFITHFKIANFVKSCQ